MQVSAKAALASLSARPAGPLKGVVRAPGDKSISHRALILGGLATGASEIFGLLEGDDVLRTAAAVNAFGAKVERLGEGRWRVEGQGRYSEPSDVVDCGNSGTGVRLIMGAAAGFDLAATYTGDVSLRGRPMGRVLEPLGLMGARWLARDKVRLPITVRGGSLKTIRYRLPMASAQVKSALLLAGLNAPDGIEVIEPQATRDHTERLLRAFGAQVQVSDEDDGRHIRLAGGQALTGCEVKVPGDPSSAAFPLVAALITPGSQVTVQGVLLNPLRVGLFDTLRDMGADLTVSNPREEGGEPVGDLTARHSRLKGIEVPAARAPSMIDEYPILSVAAAFAEEFVAPAVAEFAVRYPGIEVELNFDQHIVDLVREGFDMAIRYGPLAESTYVARRIAPRRLHVCASVEYLARRGTPVRIDDLRDHDCLIGTSDQWLFRGDTGMRRVRVNGRWRSNNGRALLAATRQGLGLTQLPDFYVADDLKRGRLQTVLGGWEVDDVGVWVVYPSRRLLSANVRLMIDHLAAVLQSLVQA